MSVRELYALVFSIRNFKEQILNELITNFQNLPISDAIPSGELRHELNDNLDISHRLQTHRQHSEVQVGHKRLQPYRLHVNLADVRRCAHFEGQGVLSEGFGPQISYCQVSNYFYM